MKRRYTITVRQLSWGTFTLRREEKERTTGRKKIKINIKGYQIPVIAPLVLKARASSAIPFDFAFPSEKCKQDKGFYFLRGQSKSKCNSGYKFSV
jgi:hypothetical protein